MMKNTPKLTLIIISTTIIIASAILYNTTKSTTQGINKVIVKTRKVIKTIITKCVIKKTIKTMHYMLNKISKQIILLTIIAMVIENEPTRKNNRETTSLKDNTENNNPPEEKNNGNQISIAAWNIKCNNRELPELEKEAIKKRWDIVFISETGLMLSKIGPPTIENQILLQDYITI